ncbi:hypothetical protein CCR75_000914 [Bremia lactucae]|uniref:Heme haloperoxidase family profile domain-containing protein n=1 Tax=Bremia lactucae TaxID=4779 RepID=A0A976FKV7_BRELC|nr:hypothetical protein CCR75_000914 [Bremia lactucae]
MVFLWKPLLLLFCTSHTLTAIKANGANHTYIRPSGPDVSGFPPPNSASNHRSPCPALNSLANHAYLPRDGKSLTPQLIRDAVINVFNIDPALAKRLTKALPPQLTLADLSVHGLTEHDASLVHDDAWCHHDPAQINSTLVDFLISTSKNGELSKRSLAMARRERETQCKKENPTYTLPLKTQAVAYGEAALLLIAMGNYESETITVETMKSFLLQEKIPNTFKKSNKPLTTAKVVFLSAQIRLLALFGAELETRNARASERD